MSLYRIAESEDERIAMLGSLRGQLRGSSN
jgi:hypothetical protein